MKIWQAIKETIEENDVHIKRAKELFEIYNSKGYWTLTTKKALLLPDEVIILFYSYLEESKETKSPVENYSDSSWMIDADFCFINIKATGTDENSTGNFIQAAKLLPGIRANSIHLGPFTLHDFNVIYAVSSVKRIDYKIIHSGLKTAGICDDDQLRALINGIHLLDKTAGFDLEPHVTQFSYPVLANPDFFRWIKLNSNKTNIIHSLSQNEMQKETIQKLITGEIKCMIKEILTEEGYSDINQLEIEIDIKKREEVFHKLVKILIDRGYWTIPSQVYSCSGIPQFRLYNFEQNYAEFLSVTPLGEDVSDQGYKVLTPFKFSCNMQANTSPGKNSIYDSGIDFFADIFPYWRDNFNFDFVRYDSVDHIFDSITGENRSFASSDRPSPEVLKTCIKRSKSTEKPYIGNLAERMGDEIDEYSSIGFDSMLGSAMLKEITPDFMNENLNLYTDLCKLNNNSIKPFALAFAIDTHDTGNPYLRGKAIVETHSKEELTKRLFLSRFLNIGLGKRNKYEVMGLNDRSYGLYEANIKDKSLVLRDDKEFNLIYHMIEDSYVFLKNELNQGTIKHRSVSYDGAYWQIKSPNMFIDCGISFHGTVLRDRAKRLWQAKPEIWLLNDNMSVILGYTEL